MRPLQRLPRVYIGTAANFIAKVATLMHRNR
jgi:hypothetical protein